MDGNDALGSADRTCDAVQQGYHDRFHLPSPDILRYVVKLGAETGD